MKLRKRRELVVKKKPRKRHTLRTIFKYKKCACGVAQYEFKGFPEIFNELRLKSQLCDGIVRCDDGTEFLVHRVILSVVSPYFKVECPFCVQQIYNFFKTRPFLPIP